MTPRRSLPRQTRVADRCGIASAAITAFYLFDVAEAITLADLPEAIRRLMSEARLVPTPAIPSYVGYQQPPRVLEGAAVGIEGPAGFTSRFKVYDYGIVSVALTRPFAGSWAELMPSTRSSRTRQPRRRPGGVPRAGRRAGGHGPPRRSFLTDYVVFVVTALPGCSGARLQAIRRELRCSCAASAR
jgi:hypothetical protein